MDEEEDLPRENEKSPWLAPAVLLQGGSFAVIVLWMLFTFVSGGVRSTTQTSLDQFGKDLKAARGDIANITTWMSTQPRQSDWQEISSHLARIDGSLNDLNSRLGKDESQEAVMQDRLDRLWYPTTAGVRNPPGGR